MKFRSELLIIPLLMVLSIGIFINMVYFSDKKEEKHADSDHAAVSFDGEALYEKSCLACHGDQYQGAAGPALKGVGDKFSDEEIVDILKNGKGTLMPAGLVKEQDLEHMKDFLKSL